MACQRAPRIVARLDRDGCADLVQHDGLDSPKEHTPMRHASLSITLVATFMMLVVGCETDDPGPTGPTTYRPPTTPTRPTTTTPSVNCEVDDVDWWHRWNQLPSSNYVDYNFRFAATRHQDCWWEIYIRVVITQSGTPHRNIVRLTLGGPYPSSVFDRWACGQDWCSTALLRPRNEGYRILWSWRACRKERVNHIPECWPEWPS